MNRLLILIAVIIGSSACSTTIDKQQLNQVKTVAIAGVNVFRMADDQFHIDEWFSSNREFSENLANDFVDGFNATLQQRMAVRVIPREQLIANPYYQELETKYGGVKKLLFAIGKSYRAPGMLAGQAIFDLTPEERIKLARSLGVDSIVGIEAQLYAGAMQGVTFNKPGTDIGIAKVNFRVTISNYEQFSGSMDESIVDITNLIGGTPNESHQGFALGSGMMIAKRPGREPLLAAVNVVADKLANKLIAGE